MRITCWTLYAFSDYGVLANYVFTLHIADETDIVK